MIHVNYEFIQVKKKKEVNEQIENIPYNRQANIFPLDLSNFYTAIHLI